VRFFLSCVPPTVNHQRKKIVRLKLRDGRQIMKLGDKDELVAAKDSLDALLLPHQPPVPVAGPVRLSVCFTWPFLKSHPRKFSAHGRRPHTSKPDLSNVIKTLEDRIVALRFIEDDRSVVELHLSKFWGQSPGISIEIESLASAVPLANQEASRLERMF
jgi:Holliday junction resolvase RusA-like endonuclease